MKSLDFTEQDCCVYFEQSLYCLQDPLHVKICGLFIDVIVKCEQILKCLLFRDLIVCLRLYTPPVLT